MVIAILYSLSCTSAVKITERHIEQLNGNSTPFNFFVLGDWGRKGGLSQAVIADQMIVQAKKLHPNFIITVGDNFYEEGVSSITDSHWDSSFNNIYKELTFKYNWYVTLGNHDYRGNPEAEINYHKVNSHWILPSRYYTEVFETPDHQKVRFLFIDTDPFYTDYYSDKRMPEIKLQDTAAQRKWIIKTLEEATEPWKIVVGHHPVYSSSSTKGNTPELLNMLSPILEKYGVQAYICGHNHDFQHNHPQKGKVDYIVSGAGSEEKETGKFVHTIFSQNIGGFTDISINNDSLAVTFIDKNGNVIYTFSRHK